MAGDTWILTLFLTIITFQIGLQYNTEVLNPGKDIELTCEDDDPVQWCYPPKYKHIDDPERGNAYKSKTTETEYSPTSREIMLKIENPTYEYTGYYHCVKKDSNVPCERKMETVIKSTYVFVEDPTNLLVVSGFITLQIHKNGIGVLPCIPTHPDITVTLKRGADEIQLGKQDDSTLTVSYDKTTGFKLQPFTVRDSEYYYCEAKRDKVTQDLSMYAEAVDPPLKNLMTPTLIKDSITVKNEVMAREGTTLELVCRGLIGKDQSSQKLSFTWNIPDQSKLNITQTSCKQSNYRCLDSKLTIKNVTQADAGKYSCSIGLKNLKSNVSAMDLQVIGMNVTAVVANTTWNGSIPVPRGPKPMKIVVDYTAPETVTVNWYGPDGKIDAKSSKYNTSTTATQTILNVINISLRDAGPYSVEIFDRTMKPVWLNISALILDKPEVELHSPTLLFNPGKNVTFTCRVYSPPPVDIRWTLTKCNLMNSDNSCEEKSIILNNMKFNTFQKVYVLNTTLKITEEGILHCEANNTCSTYCGMSNKTKKIYLTDLQELNKTLSIIDEPEEIVSGSTLTLSCAASRYFFQSFPSWDVDKLKNFSDKSEHTHETQYTFFNDLTLHNLTKSVSGAPVYCEIPSSSGRNDLDVELPSVHLNIKDPEKPKITKTNLGKDIEVNMLDRTVLYCKTEGVPKPKLTWFKDDVAVVSDSKIKIDERNESLRILIVQPEHEGKYSCKANSSIGDVMKEAQLIVKGKPGAISVGLLVTILILVPILLALVIFLVVKIRKEKKLQRELNLAGLGNFEKGALENINPELPVDEQADLLPYDKTWEFPTEKLKLGKMLGAGAFGVVMKAEAYGILDNEEKTTVAVKMVKSGADRSYLKALASELKIMAHLGKHLNVVNLLGASTKRLNKMELMVIVEFCRFGNLQNYLIRHRDDFVDQVDRNTGEINLAIGMDKLARTQSAKSKASLKQRLLSYSSSLIGTNNSGGSSTELHAPNSPAATEVTGVASDMSVVSAPSGEPDECLLSNGSGEQPEWRVKYTGDYRDTAISVCTQNLLCWGFQIARGMEYLASRKVLHGDLAARNVLLADDNIVKICDFGLARSMYKSDNYRKKGGGPLPVKWMALESIRDHIFSTQSDVWSFGIVLWELFSLARTPYPGMEANERFLEKLLNGYRMEQPSYSPNSVYKTMLKCWLETPNDRPSFTELAEELGAMLDDNLRRHFEELNNPYVDMNEQRQSSNDYLSMMGSPNYRNLVSPTSVDPRYINSPRPSGSDYLNMKSPTSPMSVNDSVFQYPSEDQNESGYLRMSAKDNIFSPHHVDENPFKFTPTSPDNKKTEEHHMKTMPPTNADNYMNVGSSISNPSYVTTKP